MSAQHPIFSNDQLQSYFHTLPLLVQEAVLQSGVTIETVEDLRAFAEKYTAK